MRSVGPGRERSIRVLVAEAADPPVPLSSLLESAGHRVVGRASTPEEVERLLRVTRPSVVVFDAEMSVEAVAAARESYPRIGIVAVWPAGIASEKVDRVVAPAAAHEALARAVRDASPVTLRRHAAPAAAVAAAAAPTSIPARRGRGGVELGVAAVLTFLLVMAAVALRIGEGIPSLVTGAPLVDGPVVPAVTTGSPIPPPDGPSGSTDDSSGGLADLRSTTSSTAGGGGPGATGPRGGEDGPRNGSHSDSPTPPPPPPPVQTTSARERACRTAAGLPIEGQIGGPALDGELGNLFDHCLATRSRGPIRALEKFVNGGGGGSGSDGDHGGGGDGDHDDDDDDDGDHGHDGDHDDDDDDDGDHGSGHDSDHDDDDDDGGDDSDHDSDHDEHDSDDHDDDDQGEDDDDQGQDDDDQGDDD